MTRGFHRRCCRLESGFSSFPVRSVRSFWSLFHLLDVSPLSPSHVPGPKPCGRPGFHDLGSRLTAASVIFPSGFLHVSEAATQRSWRRRGNTLRLATALRKTPAPYLYPDVRSSDVCVRNGRVSLCRRGGGTSLAEEVVAKVSRFSRFHSTCLVAKSVFDFLPVHSKQEHRK